MKKLLIINTGGTFNKQYNPIDGTLDVIQDSSIVDTILKKWLCEFEVLNIIGKDSLDMTTQDRMELLATINMSDYDDFIVIHGTDTMELTAEYLADAEIEKRIVLTGAMVPYSIDPTEAAANMASAIGYLQRQDNDGVYIAMNGVFGNYTKVKKDRVKGKFIYR
ncbi:asparaginase domain-containing protein [Sulfurovum sp. zt1-1]|uniref:Asparaginase domain-containing protein n=1 Tax=Sulfurovum zhangzhouensis TaxID=3019067 RepID=A0ABT7QXX1_9BACT|nr:asparaginase domain-containing protein [Sulfurovum zhangzhouensis]MDM5271677.1 asparaginase domain-containing protein [Sulfurovum zhangzhouensis]